MNEIDALERRAVYLIGARGRRLFLMDDDGTYWVRADMTPAEAENTADSLASWLHHAVKCARLGSHAAVRLYDDGEKVPR